MQRLGLSLFLIRVPYRVVLRAGLHPKAQMTKKSTADKALQKASKALTHHKMDIFRAIVLDLHYRGEDLNRSLDPVNSTLLHRACAAGEYLSLAITFNVRMSPSRMYQ